MNPSLALFAFIIGIAGLFWLDRDDLVRPSKALWLPVVWLSISGSRSLSVWLGMGAPQEVAGQLPQGSLLDQLIAASLMLVGAIVLIRRGKEVTRVLKASWPIVLYFSFALVSLTWSDFPVWGLKRWIRALGDLVMVLIVVTEAQPTTALRRLYSRIGFVLLPASVLLIRYYPQLGQGWDEYGYQAVVGVTTNKNALGNLAQLIGLGVLWQLLSLDLDRDQPHRARRLLAQCTLLAFGIYLLSTAQCATAVACFTLGAGLMLVISRPLFRRRPAAVHALVLAVLLVGGLTELLGGRDVATRALGRKPDLTGRTEIWRILIPMAPNPIGGAGFETFWAGPRVAEVFTKVGGPQMTNESHNGYIEVYLNLGCLGVGLIVVILVHGYRRAVRVFRRDSALGALLLACVVVTAAFNITEAGFRMLSQGWFFLLLSIVAANRVITLGDTAPEPARVFSDRVGRRAETVLSRNAVINSSGRREPRAARILVDSKKGR